MENWMKYDQMTRDRTNIMSIYTRTWLFWSWVQAILWETCELSPKVILLDSRISQFAKNKNCVTGRLHSRQFIARPVSPFGLIFFRNKTQIVALISLRQNYYFHPCILCDARSQRFTCNLCRGFRSDVRRAKMCEFLCGSLKKERKKKLQNWSSRIVHH